MERSSVGVIKGPAGGQARNIASWPRGRTRSSNTAHTNNAAPSAAEPNMETLSSLIPTQTAKTTYVRCKAANPIKDQVRTMDCLRAVGKTVTQVAQTVRIAITKRNGTALNQ